MSTQRRNMTLRGLLTDKAVDAAKPGDKDYKLADGNSLFVLVRASGAKLWRFKYHFAGKEKLMALGQYPEIRLAAARQKRGEARQLILQGIDPMQERKAVKTAQRLSASNSFRSVAEQWWKSWSAGKSEQHAGQVWRRFEANVFPSLGARPVDQIEAPELVSMMKALEGRNVIDLAKRALQTTNQVFRYAIAHGLAHRNPAADIRPSDLLPSVPKRNLARIEARELPELLRRIEGYEGSPVTRLALKLIAMTFVRTKELIGAKWEEFDLEQGVWSVPAARMKMKTPHLVPLSRQAIEVLKTLHLITGHRELLFPGERDYDKFMSNNTILGALNRMGYKGQMTGHGFRGLASTILHENGFDHAHIELQLAHQQRDKVAAAYNHATYLRQRAEMMQWWADYLERCRSGNVIPLRRLAA